MERGEKLTVLAGPSSLPVWERMPGLEGVETAPFPPAGPGGALRLAAWTLRSRRRFRGCGRVVYLGRSPAVRRWLRFLTAAPLHSGGERPLGDYETVRPQRAGELVSQAFAAMAGVRPRSLRPLFPLRREERRAARDRLGEGEWLAVAPGGGDNPRDSVREKRWDPRRLAEVCGRVVARGTRVLLLGGPRDAEAAARVEALVPEALNLVGETGWGETAALMAAAGRFLGADSGPAHLATAVGADAVVLFGPTSPACLYAPGLVRPVVSPAECSPCYANMPFPGCPRDGRCMDMIGVEAVMEALEPMLAGGGEG
jgi:hypothetical protein